MPGEDNVVIHPNISVAAGIVVRVMRSLETFMTPAIFMGAYIVDIIVGDPRWFLHPVVIIGKAVRLLEDKICRTSLIGKKKGGIILWFTVVIPTFFITWGAVEGCLLINPLFGVIITVLLASLTLATKSLYNESKVVLNALNRGDIEEARKSLSMIVGRDTENLDEQGICRAVIETVSENLSDGIVAPMFYLAIGGVPLAMAYKAINTLDSMVGYKNERYADIGWFSAKMDDIWNWIPARLTGFIIILAAFILRLNWMGSWRVMRRDGRNHSSPNSGMPEAAAAGAMNIQLGGRIQYFGKITNKPTIGDRIKETGRDDVKKAWIIMFFSSLLMGFVCMAVLGMVQ